jgi:dienelactone hydrolase
VSCPILAFFGTRDDVGTEADLKLLQSAADRHSRRVQTAMIAGGDHLYAGEEMQVARVIFEWMDRVVASTIR